MPDTEGPSADFLWHRKNYIQRFRQPHIPMQRSRFQSPLISELGCYMLVLAIIAIGDSLDNRGSNACVSGAFNFAIVELKVFPSKLMVLVIFL